MYFQTERKIGVTLRVPEHLLNRVDYVRTRNGMTRTEWLRRTIAAALIPDLLVSDIRDAIHETWALHVWSDAQHCAPVDNSFTTPQWIASLSTAVAPARRLPQAWIDAQSDVLMERALEEVRSLTLTELQMLSDQERGEQRREHIILRYVAEAMKAADAFATTREEL